MKPTLHLINLASTPILQQLQWEEALLRADQRNWCLLNYGSPPAIVMGISGQIDQLIQQEKLQQSPLPLIRRFSGGGTVIVDENTLFITLICQADALPISPFPRHLMQWTADLYRPLFAALPFQLQENDYVLGERKWGGNAQSITKGRWLHHSSLLWDYRSEYMDYLSLPAKAPAYRQGRSHADFLCRLCDYWSQPELFQNQFIDQLNQHFHLVESGIKEIEMIATLPHRKVTCVENEIKKLPKGTGHCAINTVCTSGSASQGSSSQIAEQLKLSP
jgi:lipoate-protein ligase A